MWFEDHQWHYDYVRLAWDTGFSFEKWKSPNLDKNKICLVDVDRIVRERDVASIDRYISVIVQYILDDEQAKVLDINFVKVFKISQLAVEFLLFCKKYLDNTVVLLKNELSKNREENKELKSFVEDLQSHIATLTTHQALSTFKCSICSKVFSSEEYLNSHIKRRHQNGENYNVETDKLNSEIKELKERLNTAEKQLKEKEGQSHEKIVMESDNNGFKMDQLLGKFEEFKRNVDSELKELRMQKSFYEENYGRLFDIVMNNKESVEPKKSDIDETTKMETTTQTDRLLQIENVHDRNVLEIKEPVGSEIIHEDEYHCNETKENLEAKISRTLAGIEDQMQAFWNKFNAIEQTKTSTEFEPRTIDTQNKMTEEAKPKIKPRSKLSQPTCNTIITGENAENIKKAIYELEQKQNEEKEEEIKHHEPQITKSIKLRKSDVIPEDIFNNSEEKSISESESSAIQSSLATLEETDLVNPVVPTVEEQFVASKVVLKKLNKEIRGIVFSRLQELGISKSWSGIPERSFEKSLKILNHQAALAKKKYSSFESLKKKINCDVEKKISRKTISKSKLETTQSNEKKQNLIKISCRPKSSRKIGNHRNLSVKSKSETLEIKNRALYESDTESEKNPKTLHRKVVASTREPPQIYSNVINQLKSIPTVNRLKDEDSDMDDLNKKDDTQKGVLKSFLSAGSLSKKKVIFNLGNDSSKTEDAPVVQKMGGSTTSVASSILEDSVLNAENLVKYVEKEGPKYTEKTDKTYKVQELPDLSDIEFSDL